MGLKVKKMKILALIIVLVFASLVGGCIVPVDQCPWQEVCGNGCMPVGANCCGSNEYCDPGFLCGPSNTCVSPYAFSNPCAGCFNVGQECCVNYDGTVDCVPLGVVCCGNHRYCSNGTVCGGTCGDECCY